MMTVVRLMYLLDTNIVSELRNGNSVDHGLLEFLIATNAQMQHCQLSVVTVGELRRGIERVRHQGDVKQANTLSVWYSNIVTQHSDSILPINQDVAAIGADLRIPNHENALDKSIGATTLLYSLQVVTRNTKDFEKLGVSLVNPFSAG